MMKCVLCQAELKEGKSSGPRTYYCQTDKLPDNFNHYYIQLDEIGKIIYQGYVIGKYFVQVYDKYSYIFLNDDLEMKEIVAIPRPLWLNSKNIEQTLTTVKLCVMFS